MTTLLLISQDDEGNLTAQTNVTKPVSATQLMRIFPALKQLYPGLRHGTLPYEGPNPELAQDLIAWRREQSLKEGVFAYIVLSQATLFAIADAAPQNEEELMSIPGFGQKKMELYGMDILRITCQ